MIADPPCRSGLAAPIAGTREPVGEPVGEPLAIGGRRLRCRVLQSPLAGVSDAIFRQMVRRWAPDALLFTEMVNATSLELGHGRRKIEELGGDSGPIGGQLCDHRPAAVAEGARRAAAAGGGRVGCA
ncbi:MAG: tRNA-dihydrouridine synthase, partial [Synechococcaceae cyanobacterium]